METEFNGDGAWRVRSKSREFFCSSTGWRVSIQIPPALLISDPLPLELLSSLRSFPKARQTSTTMSKKRSRTESAIAPFILSLWDMVTNPANHKHINWAHNGTSIKVTDPPTFAATVIPKYFKHKNIPSFVRQLNLYGFKKTRQDPNFLEFTHEMFTKGHHENLKHCTRKKPNKPTHKKSKTTTLTSPSGSGSSSSTDHYTVPGTTPSDFAAQREALDRLIHDMAGVHQRQTDLDEKVAELQQQNAELKDANRVLQFQAFDSATQQQKTQGELKTTFHFMLQLWEQLKSEGGTLGNARNRQIKRLPFNDMQRRPVIQALEDNRTPMALSSLHLQQPASSTSSSRLAAAMRASGVQGVTTPRSISRTNSEVVAAGNDNTTISTNTTITNY